MRNATSPHHRTTDLARLHEAFVNEQRYAARSAPATLAAYRTSFQLFMKLLPHVTVDQLTPETLTEFFRRLETRRRPVGNGERVGVMASTVATHRGKLGRFFSWLAAQGHLTENPFTAMPYPRVEYEGREYLGKAEIDNTMELSHLVAKLLDAPIAELDSLWQLWSPQLDAYVLRALDPDGAPAFGAEPNEDER